MTTKGIWSKITQLVLNNAYSPDCIIPKPNVNRQITLSKPRLQSEFMQALVYTASETDVIFSPFIIGLSPHMVSGCSQWNNSWPQLDTLGSGLETNKVNTARLEFPFPFVVPNWMWTLFSSARRMSWFSWHPATTRPSRFNTIRHYCLLITN